MGDYSTCKHGGAIGYCDICSPGWEQELQKDDALDAIYQRGYERGLAARTAPAGERERVIADKPWSVDSGEKGVRWGVKHRDGYSFRCERDMADRVCAALNLAEGRSLSHPAPDMVRVPLPPMPPPTLPLPPMPPFIPVPAEPTKEMLEAGMDAIDTNGVAVGLVWKAMLSAAQSAKQRGGG